MSPVSVLRTSEPFGAVGDPSVYVSQRWYSLPFCSPASGTITADWLYFQPFSVAQETTFDRIAAWVQVAGNAGSVLRAGVYSDTGTGLPNALLLDAGTQVADTTNEKDWTISLKLPPGRYWLACAAQSAPTTVPQVIRNNCQIPTHGSDTFSALVQARMGLVKTGVTGALPATITGWATTAADIRLGLRAL